MALECLQPLPGCVSPQCRRSVGPCRSDPIEAGSTASANFILLLLNRLYLPFTLPWFSLGKRK